MPSIEMAIEKLLHPEARIVRCLAAVRNRTLPGRTNDSNELVSAIITQVAPGLAVWQDVAWRADPYVGLKRVGSAHLGWNDGPALANAIGAGVTPGLST